MADVMKALQDALSDLADKKKVFDSAADAVNKASAAYESAKAKTVQLRVEVDKQLDSQLLDAGISPTDSRVTQSE